MKCIRQSKLIGIRNEKGYTQEYLADLLDIHINTYRKKEWGAIDFKLSEANKISQLFQMRLEDIFLN